MNATVLTSTERQTRITGHQYPLTRVVTWELRRFLASRLFWFQALGFWGFLLLIIWALHASGQIGTVAGSEQLSAYVAGTSAGGLLRTLPTYLIILALLLWVGMVLSATILVSSVGFAMSTLWPRLSMLIKAVIMMGWLIGALVIPLSFRDATSLPGWYVNWDPTSGITALGLLPAYKIGLNSSITNEAQLLQFILSVENKMPDLAGWFVPHLLLAGLSLGLVLVAALAFKRSRDVLN